MKHSVKLLCKHYDPVSNLYLLVEANNIVRVLAAECAIRSIDYRASIALWIGMLNTSGKN